jgi:hypothetical protein
MTDAEIAQVDQESMTQSEKAALKLVEDMAARRHTGAEGLAKYVIDREEGRAVEKLQVEETETPQIVLFGRSVDESPKQIEAHGT